MTNRRPEPLRGSMEGDGVARLLGSEDVDRLLAEKHEHDDEEEDEEDDE